MPDGLSTRLEALQQLMERTVPMDFLNDKYPGVCRVGTRWFYFYNGNDINPFGDVDTVSTFRRRADLIKAIQAEQRKAALA